jgi:hypothetical protein
MKYIACDDTDVQKHPNLNLGIISQLNKLK